MRLRRRDLLCGGIPVLGLVIAGPVLARASVPAIDYPDIQWRPPPGAARSLDAVRDGIVRALQTAGWRLDSSEASVLRASYYVRGKHIIRVRIGFDVSKFSVHYDGSTNMNHWVNSDGVNLIHPNYNSWTERLVAAIRTELERG